MKKLLLVLAILTTPAAFAAQPAKYLAMANMCDTAGYMQMQPVLMQKAINDLSVEVGTEDQAQLMKLVEAEGAKITKWDLSKQQCLGTYQLLQTEEQKQASQDKFDGKTAALKAEREERTAKAAKKTEARAAKQTAYYACNNAGVLKAYECAKLLN